MTALASYAWSHCIDWGSFNVLVGYQRGNCDFDVRHNLSGALSYDVPKVGHSRLASSVLQHWGIDQRFTARTGFPVFLSGNFLTQKNGKGYDQGLDFASGQPVYVHGANCAKILQTAGELQTGQGCPGGVALNPNAFMDVTCTTSSPCFGDRKSVV